ncbi:hypothetical protein OUZ56_003148 [Daphnia magna]|uniref:Uncharacterized protein n=1 Tax=Daphnia magna TaxID=35525 RepID=A0ABR0A7W2_9CRUS|nr:hypothetical protein OUZ56_003148 [Daphnia magna]
MSQTPEICSQVLTESMPTNLPQSGSDAGDYYSSWRLPEQISRETLSARRPCGTESQLVKSCGGQSESDAICRAWIKITSVECRAACNWKGVKRGNHQKHGLKLSSVTDAVFKGIKMNANYKDLTDAVFESEAKKLFIRSPEKIRNKRKCSASTPADTPGLTTDVD